MKVYVTFHYNYLGGYAPIVIKCESTKNALDILHDADSLVGYSHVSLNKSGRFRKDALVKTESQYWNYTEHNNWEKEYYDKCFNPENFKK